MKRILQAIAAAVLVGASHAALALDADMALDRFPSGGGRAVSGVHDRRAGATGRSGSFHEPRIHHHRSVVQDRHGHGGHRARGSVIDIRPLGGAVERGSFYGTAGTARSSFIVVGLPDVAGGLAAVTGGGLGGGAKILDVEADRLDRRPYGQDGLAVAHVGTAKIIRISPGFRRGREPEEVAAMATEPVRTPFAELGPAERAVTVYPDTEMAERPVDPPPPRVAEAAPAPAPAVPAPTPAPAQAPEAAPYLEPWTPDWLRDCVARHPDFDASLGTYTDAGGRRRFCTGEP